MDHVNAWNWKVSLSWDERDTEYPDLLDWEMCVVNHRLFMPYNILGCYITGLYMTFNQCQFLLSTSPLCVDIVVLDMHPSRLGDWSCLARNQQAMAWQHMDGHRVAVSCHTSCSLSQVHQNLLPTTINLIHSLSHGQCVVGVLLAGHFSVRYTRYTDAGDQYLIIMARLHRLPPSLLPWSEEVIATKYGVVVAEYDKHGCVHLSGCSYV